MRKLLVILLLFIIFSPVLALDVPVSKIACDSLLRIELSGSWFIDPPGTVLSRRPVRRELPSSERVEIRAEGDGEEIAIIVARELYSGNIATDTKAARARRPENQFPGWAQGSWILTRKRDTGACVLIKIFLRSDWNTFIQFRPFDKEKCLMDVVLYGGYMVQSLPVAVPLERIYTMQLNDILKLAGSKFPRRYFDVDPALYRDNRTLVAQVRQKIRGLRFADDGAMNENGDFVLINTLERQSQTAPGVNCSGFAKWLIDGILRPVTGKRLPIPPLKQPFGDRGSSFTDGWEERRDPYFGLDWIRHLAAEANGHLRSPSHRRLEEFEVRADNFSLLAPVSYDTLITSNKNMVLSNYPGFLPEAGYGIEGLPALLYTLAVEQPFYFYLAAINTERGTTITEQNPRGGPRLREYYHIVAIFPYFDEESNFRIAVFESLAQLNATESSINGFRRRYPNHYFNLVQIPVSARFDP